MHRTNQHYDVVVAGAGSGGFGAATAAAQAGLQVLLFERGPWLGGTAMAAGVNNWEPGVGGTGLPFHLYKRLKRRGDAIGISRIGRHFSWDGPGAFPGGETVLDPNLRYADSLRRHGMPPFHEAEAFAREHLHSVVFEPEPYEAELRAVLAETGRVTLRLETAFTHVSAQTGHVESVTLDSGETVHADVFVDATGGGALCAAAGCERALGQEPRSRYDEPSAPDAPTERLNAASLIFRIDPAPEEAIEPLPPGVSESCWWRDAFPPIAASRYPRGGYCCNPLPVMEGAEALALGFEQARTEALRRVRALWHDIQTRFPEFRRYRMTSVAPMMGVRESHRVIGEYVLTEHDLRAGYAGQTHPDIIALADHAADVHGSGGGLGELDAPYGVPYRCLIPKGFDNLLVACRGASFSSIGGSSCRLSRTMMTLGEAAGAAAALARDQGVGLTAVPPDALRTALRARRVQVDWPTPPDLRDYLADE